MPAQLSNVAQGDNLAAEVLHGMFAMIRPKYRKRTKRELMALRRKIAADPHNYGKAEWAEAIEKWRLNMNGALK